MRRSVSVLQAGAAFGIGFGLLIISVPASGAESPSEHAAGDDQGSALQEIIVTAQRRAESAQKSSVDLQVVKGDQLAAAGVTQATDLSSIVPGLSVSIGGSSVQTYLRGVGTFATDAAAESSIAYNIDGVYISRPSGIGPIFFDLARVEVLKGPQGTLYGRNASGGAINLVTNKPENDWSGGVTVNGGNYGLRQITGVLNAPIGSEVSVRLAGETVDHDGYLTDGYDDQKTRAARLTGLWNASDNFSLQIMGEYSHIGGQGEGVVRRSLLQPSNSSPWLGASDPSQQPPSAHIPGGTHILPDGYTNNDARALSAELTWTLPFATLTFLPAVRTVDVDYVNYTPGFLFQDEETSRQHSYELRLANHTAGGINWVAGAYYYDESQTEHYNDAAVPFQDSFVNEDLTTRSWAGFGQGSFSITPTLRFIAGARYTHESKSQKGSTTTILPVAEVSDDDGARTFDNASWKTGFEYDVADESMLFLTAATGFKAGGFVPSIQTPRNSYGPEKLLAYTLGSRNRFADNRLQVNAEGFYWKYKDKQERYLGITPSGATGLLTTNAGQATLYGASLDVQWLVSLHDTISLNAEYLHSRYNDFTYTVYNPRGGSYAPQATGCRLGTAVPAPLTPNPIDTVQSVDCAGESLPKAPTWSGSAGFEHTVNLSTRGLLTAEVDATFASRQYLTTDFIGSGSQAGYALLNSSLTLSTADRHWSIALWGRNLTDAAVYSAGFRYPFSAPVAAGGDPTLVYSPIRPPRTYGVRASYAF